MSYGTGIYGTGIYGVAATPLPMVVTAEPTGTAPADRPRMRIALNTGDPDAVFLSLSIRRDGQPLRAEIPVGVTDPFVFDYEAPFGRPVTYTATGTYGPPSGTGGAIAFSATAEATLNEPDAWLIHPTYPSLSVKLGRGGDDAVLVTSATAVETVHEIPRAIFKPPGRRRAVVFPLGPRRDGEWTLVLFTHALPARDSVLAILADGGSLMLRTPAGWDWDLPDGWYSVGDVTPRRVGPVSRELTLPLTPAESPPVTLASATTWRDIYDAGLPWGEVLDDYGTWYGVLTGEPQ